jgi:hypothetical protein
VLAAGFCIHGDLVQPTCPDGYGADSHAIAGDTTACGLGVCCTPCPASSDPHVDYVSDDPAVCATLDFECAGPVVRQFDNECGCGCVTE